MIYRVERYNDSFYYLWNELISHSKNGSFLFHRQFMEYHSDRFEDFSLLLFKGEKLTGCFPANVRGSELISHQGLTYGGLIYDDLQSLEDVYDMFSAIVKFAKDKSLSKILLKQVPALYHKAAANELDFALHRFKARVYHQNINLAIDYSKEVKISKSKLKHFRRISNAGLEIRQDQDFSVFWDKVLVPRLYERYNSAPVHSKEEIQLLHNRFPENILQLNVYYNGEIVAGLTLFYFCNVIKSQYGATTKQGEELRALDYVFITLIKEYQDKAAYFDMGTVNDNNAMGYNKGLLQQKQELGCAIYIQNFYEVRTDIDTNFRENVTTI